MSVWKVKFVSSTLVAMLEIVTENIIHMAMAMPDYLDHQWQTFSRDANLSENTVHVWRVTLHTPVSLVQYYQRYLLTEEEITRAGRYHFEKDRNHFIAAHGILRILLGRYLNVEPRQLRFSLNAYGKPSLEPSLQVPPLSFNMSHSRDLALYAFTYARQIGVDVENIRLDDEVSEYEQLAHHYFSPYERNVLQTLPVEEKRQAFFQCWARKEAYIKAKGTGLSLPLIPRNIAGTVSTHRECHHPRHCIGMHPCNETLKLFIQVLAAFEHTEPFFAVLLRVVPAIDTGDRPKNLNSRRELLVHRSICNSLRLSFPLCPARPLPQGV